MPIRWDTLLARHVARELDDALAGARVRALRLDAGARDLALLMRERTLLWRLHPLRGYLITTAAVEPDGADIRLRVRIEGVRAPPDERIVRFELLRARGAGPDLDLIVELLGNQWNALVTEGAAGVIRHVLWTREGGRRLVVGQAYEPPTPSGRAGLRGDLSLERWRALLAGVPPEARPRALVRQVAWTSPLNAPALAGGTPPPGSSRGGRDAAEDPLARDPDGDAAALGPDGDAAARGHALWLRMAPGDVAPEPVVMETDRGLQPYPFPLPGLKSRACPSVLAALETCAAGEGERADAAAARLRLGLAALARLDAGVEQARRRGERLRAQLQDAQREDARALRSDADLILARYGEIPAGATRAVLSGFDGAERTIELDPSSPPHENASRLYGRAAKIERARETLPALLAEADTEHAALQALLERAAEGSADAAEIREAVPDAPPTDIGGGRTARRPYRVFRSSGGLEIRVGRGARHNDELTFRHSAPGDVWMHAQQSPGAHVVLRWSGPGAPPGRDLEEAAALAALHSRARHSGVVPVDWTLRKYVRKPRGSGPGTVVPDRVQTVFVRPDPALLEALTER